MPTPDEGDGESLRLVGRLFPGFAHELGNPLNSISSLAQVAERRYGDPELVVRLHKIVEHASRIEGLVRELLALLEPARPGEAELDLADLARAALRLQRLDKPGRAVSVRLEVEDPPPRVRGSRDRLVPALAQHVMAAARGLVTGSGPPEELRVEVGRARGRPCVRLRPFRPPADGELERVDAVLAGQAVERESEEGEVSVLSFPGPEGRAP